MRLVALVDVVVHQPGVAREADPLAGEAEIGLLHHPVLEVAQLVGVGGDQVEEHHVEVGLAGRLPAAARARASR